jgi:hypothetical protein
MPGPLCVKIPHNLVAGIKEHHKMLKIRRFGERFVTLLSQIHSSHFQFTVLNNPLIWSVLLTQYRAGDKIEKNEMGCSTYGGRERCVQGFGGET